MVLGEIFEHSYLITSTSKRLMNILLHSFQFVFSNVGILRISYLLNSIFKNHKYNLTTIYLYMLKWSPIINFLKKMEITNLNDINKEYFLDYRLYAIFDLCIFFFSYLNFDEVDGFFDALASFNPLKR